MLGKERSISVEEIGMLVIRLRSSSRRVFIEIYGQGRSLRDMVVLRMVSSDADK